MIAETGRETDRAAAAPPGREGSRAPRDSGPGATLRYAAGGTGGPGFPGSTAWNTILGRYWSHDYAQRVILDPALNNDTHVWLIAPDATFREFTNLSGGIYQTASPSDEYRKLYRTASGWELHQLDGMVHFFDGSGLWTQTVDRNGNAKVGDLYRGQAQLRSPSRTAAAKPLPTTPRASSPRSPRPAWAAPPAGPGPTPGRATI